MASATEAGTPSALAVKQVCCIAETIVMHANAIDRDCYYVGESCDVDELNEAVCRLRGVARLMGMLADMAVEKLGGSVGRTPEEWLLPPSYPAK